jgi:hypothetical protein
MISKKIALVISVLAFLLSAYLSYSYFGGQGAGGGIIYKYRAPAEEVGLEEIEKGPKTEECPMNGKLMTRGQKARWESRRPMGVMIENHLDARPQSGLSRADILYEVVAEGGITRFLAIYYCDEAPIMGPVRSARIYYVKLLQEYGQYPLYAHVGGANTPGPADALGEVRDLGWDGYNDMNQFAVPFPYYYRDYDRLPDRATEHTMYASTAKLWDYAKKERDLTNVDKKGKKWDSGFVSWKFKNDAVKTARGNTTKISFGFWSKYDADNYNVTWQYDRETNSYKRSHGTRPHIDKNTGKPLTAKNIFVVFADESPANDGYPGGHLLYDVVGSGDAIFFQDGKAVKGTWRKKDEETRMRFIDTSGAEISIVRGQVFVEILPIGNKVTY